MRRLLVHERDGAAGAGDADGRARKAARRVASKAGSVGRGVERGERAFMARETFREGFHDGRRKTTGTFWRGRRVGAARRGVGPARGAA